jgi:hypothetical protein
MGRFPTRPAAIPDFPTGTSSISRLWLATNSHLRAVTSMEWAPMKSAARLILSRSKMEKASRLISPNDRRAFLLNCGDDGNGEVTRRK